MGWMNSLRKRQAATAPAKPVAAPQSGKVIGGLAGQAGTLKPATAPTATPMGRIGGGLLRPSR